MDAEAVKRITASAQRVVGMLIDRDYAGLGQMCRDVRLSAQALELAVRDYGRTLCPLPEESWSNLDVVEVTGATPPRFAVRVDVWTVEEGRSDLSLELTLIDEGEALSVEIDDLHIL